MFKMPTDEKRGLALVLYAVEGWGKTTTAAFAPGSALILSPTELGYLTLHRHGRVPDRQYAVAEDWNDLLSHVGQIDDSVKVLALDALGGMERLCHEHICATQFRDDKGKPDWGEKGFLGFMRGYERSIPEWQKLLVLLNDVLARGIHVLVLGHARVTTFKNPLGPDFDRYTNDVHYKTWGITHKWADAVLFGNFHAVLEKDGQRTKGIGGNDRILCCQRSDAYDAKNRFGLPDVIDMPNDPRLNWKTIQDAIVATMKGAKG